MGRPLSLLLCCLFLATSCASKRTRPDAGVMPAEALSDALFDSCSSVGKREPTRNDALCDKRKLADVDVGILRLGRKIEKLEANVDARNQVFSVKLAESEGKRQEAEARADRYKGQRWWFLGGGVAVGIVLAVLGALAFR